MSDTLDNIETVAYQLKELDSLIFILIENYLDKTDYDYLDKMASYELCRNYPYITQLVQTIHDKVTSMRKETNIYLNSIQKEI